MIVRQAANLLEIFEYFARVQRPATLAEISAHFGWPRSSTFNLLSTLAEKGYLYEPKARSGFYPTSRLLSLVRPIAAAEPLPPWTHLLLSELSADTGETAALAVSSGVMEVFLDVVESTEPVRYSPQIGHRLPLQATASGRALLLQYSREERIALYRKMEFRPYGPTTPVSIEQLEGELRRSAERGYCLNLGGFTRDLAGIAVPLSLGERRLSVVVAGPINRVEPQVAALVERLKAGVLSAATS